MTPPLDALRTRRARILAQLQFANGEYAEQLEQDKRVIEAEIARLTARPRP